MLRCAVILLALALGACARAPTEEQLKDDLSSQLVTVFGAGTFDPVNLVSRGSAADINGPSGAGRRVVYYDVAARLTRDVNFGGWNTPGVASLVTILGAGPKGIKGVKVGGNGAGDEILAHGTAIYQPAGSDWRLVAPAGFAPAVAPASDATSPQTASEKLLAALQGVVGAAPVGTTPAAQQIVEQELSRAVAIIQGRISRLSQGYAIAAGPDGGQYVNLVQALRTSKPSGSIFQVLLTEGSVENLNLLREGRVVVALSQADIAAQSFAGTGPFAKLGRFHELRAAGSLYPEFLHIIVRADSPARSLRDLAGKRIGVGEMRSGSRVTAQRLLQAYQAQGGAPFEFDDRPLAAALSALQSGALDAVVEVIGIPANQIRTAAEVMPIRLLPIEAEVIARLMADDLSLMPGTIAVGTYPGLDANVMTLSVAAILAVTESLSEAEVALLVKAVYGAKADLLSAGSPQAGQLGAATALSGLPIPLAKGVQQALTNLADGH